MEGIKRKPIYRPLNPIEKDTLFAFYVKHGSNAHAMVRDRDCQFHSKNQLYYYRDLYNFQERYVRYRAKQAEEVLKSLADSKILAIQRAIELLKTKQIPMINKVNGAPFLDQDGQPVFMEIKPSFKEVEAAWKIIKTELGEATTIGKNDLTSGGKPIRSNVITFANFKDVANS